MKIVTKKQLNLSQLIEWIWENEIKNIMCRRLNRRVFEYIWVNENSDIEFNEGMVFKKDDVFEFKIEEEITLTTPLPSMLHVWETEVLGREMKEVENKSIASQYTGCSTEFWLKEDNKMTLIWRDGELI